MSIIRTEHVSKSFGKLEVLKDINLTVNAGEVVCIIGKRIIPLNGSMLPHKRSCCWKWVWYFNALICFLIKQCWKISCWLR